MSFDVNFKRYLEAMIQKESDNYRELKYSDRFYVHVQSHDDGKGAFEIEVIVPHESLDKNESKDPSTLSVIDGSDEVINKIFSLTKEVTGNDYSDTVFQLTAVVDDGSWEKDASVFSTFKLEV